MEDRGININMSKGIFPCLLIAIIALSDYGNSPMHLNLKLSLDNLDNYETYKIIDSPLSLKAC
jgi:hypothetical protein